MNISPIDLTIIIPLLNEEESLPELTNWIHRVAQREGYVYEIIFVDDGSTDNSWEVIKSLENENACIRGIKFRRNYGKSAALHVGFEAARGEVVITMDADLQDSPDEIPGLISRIKDDNLDLVSGWKKMRYDPMSKTLPSKLFNRVTRSISGIELHDFNCGLKAYRHDVIKTIEVYGEMHRYIPLLAKSAGFTRIGEQVVEHRARKYGHSKFGARRLLTGFLDLLTITFMSSFSKRPMHLFGMLGVLVFFVGFIILLYLSFSKLILETPGIADRPLFHLGLLTIIIGIQFFLTGFLAELVARKSHDRNNYQVEKEIGCQDAVTVTSPK